MNTIIEGIKQMLKPIQLTKTIILTAMLLLGGMTAKGQTFYIINYGSNYLSHPSATTFGNSTVFGPDNCLWTISGSYIRAISDDGTIGNYLSWADGEYYTLDLRSDNTYATWTNVGDGLQPYYRYSNTRFYYLRFGDSGWEINRYYNTNRGTINQVTKSNIETTFTNPTINGADLLTGTGNSNYTASGASYQQGGYTNYYFNSTNHYFDGNTPITPAGATVSYTWNLTPNDYATVSTGTVNPGVVNVVTLPLSDVTLTLTVTANFSGGTPAVPSGTTLTASKEITIQGTKPSAPIITVSGNTVTLSTNASGTTSIRYTLDGTEPTASYGTVYDGNPIDLSSSTTSPVTVKAVTVRNGNASDVTTAVVTLTLPEPVITVNADAGTATISCSVSGATIYYTTNGSTPTTSSSQYSGTITGLTMMQTIKAIAVKDGWNDSPVASATVTIPSGISDGVVTLFDCEPHSWAYYSDSECPVRSLSPADVKITYYGNGIMMTNNDDYTAGTTNIITSSSDDWKGSVAVGVTTDEAQNTFVYYKTLERAANTDDAWTFSSSNQSTAAARCSYTTIPNPFQKRPTYKEDANTKWRGFQCWRLKSVTNGKVFSANSGGTALATNAIINAETEFFFAPDNEYGMEVELEAVWARAYVKTGNANTLDANNTLVTGLSGGSYERNFFVITGGDTDNNINKTQNPVTISCRYPDGTSGGSLNSTIKNNFTANAVTKFEYVKLNASTFSANGIGLIIGRDCTGSVTNIHGATSAPSSSFVFRIESGDYTTSYLLSSVNGVSSGITINATYGCDYDRANNNTNTNLTFSNVVEAGYGSYMTSANGKINMTALSGTYGTNAANHEFYIGFENGSGGTSQAVRTLEVYGGVFNGGIAGGYDRSGNSASSTKVKMHIRGGTIQRYLYGAGQYSECSGARRIIITGGTFNGWIAGGAYGTDPSGGATDGNINLYFGGRASQTNTDGIFGAGYGTGTYASGQNYYTVQVSNVVFADEASTTGSVYGGGNNGFARENIQVYVAGGSVGGNVFGGANKAPSSKDVAVFVTGGTVTGNVYGGSNTSGAISGQITVDIYGTDPAPSADAYALGGVFGGGNLAPYNGKPLVRVHNCDNSIEYVYGGGNAATVTGTDVTIYGGNKIGNVFGGCYGANVTANGTDVKIYGGTIGRVYGGNNQSGTITGDIRVTVDKQGDSDPNGTLTACDMIVGEVYSGGNVAGSAAGTIDIGCTGTLTADHAAHPENIGTTLEGVGYVYGGANQAPISSAVNLNINDGIIGNVFGGNNNSGAINGAITVNIEKTGSCDWYVGNVFGGGNLALYSGTPTVTVKNGTVSGNVFGGGNGDPNDASQNPGSTGAASVTIGDLEHNAYQAIVLGDVYGGGNAAKVTGSTAPTVLVQKCNTEVGYVYGGGNAADVPATNVTITGGTISGDVYGGGHGDKDANPPLAANVTTNGTSVSISGGTINRVFGGSNSNGTITGTISVSVEKSGSCEMHITEVYGGGNFAASSAGNVAIGCTGGASEGIDYVYGGANRANITGDIGLTITGGRINNVFGGNNTSGDIDGDITVTVNWSGSCDQNYLGNVYGAGNLATYSQKTAGHPIVNIYNGTVSHSVYGGGKGDPEDPTMGVVTGNPVVTIGDATPSHCAIVTENVYGGGDAAAVMGKTTVVYNDNNASSTVAKLFGGGNAAAVSDSATVVLTSGKVTGGVYGGCNSSGSVGVATVNLNGGQVGNTGAGNSADVYGGGFGENTSTTNNIKVSLNGTTIYGDLYGGSAFGSVNTSTSNNDTINILTNTLHGTIYGGGKGQVGPSSSDSIAAVTKGNVVVNYNTANTNLTGLYGGANVNGNVEGDITVNVNANVGASGTGNSRNVFGGGLGHATNTKGNVTVNVGAADGSSNPTVYGDIYGGSALGNVNDATADLTTVNILNGTVHGNVYGGGLGDATVLTNGYLDPTEPTVQAIVNGTVHVNIGDASNTNSTPTIDGKVFGCNNLAGTPKGPVYVDIYRTAHSGENFYPNPEPSGANNIPTPTAANFAISEVYGGGNLAHYTTTVENASTHVHVHNCDNTIQYVYGGGNAANTVANEVTIDGGRMEYVFGGGNGAGTGNPGANVEGNAIVNIDGGIINYVFGGSNTLGVVNGVASMTFAAPPVCTRMVKELYGGGNEAPGGSVDLTIPCGVTGLNVVYGGSKNADIGSETLFNGGTKKNVVLTIKGGVLDKIFGGNNQGGTIWGDVTLNLKGGTIVDAFGGNNAGGNIKGTITVNVEDAESTTCPLVLTNVFGGGKDAAYTPADATISGPLVNIKHKKSGTSITGSVFGGGQGSTATVTANPVVTVGDLTSGHESYIATIDGDVYGGGDAADVVGTTTVLVQKCNTVINGDVYGGGNAADIVKNNGVGGTTSVTITGGTITGTDHGMVFGGGHGNKNANPQTEANVAGNVSVTINGGTINKVFGGSNSKGTIGGTVAVNVNKTGSCDMKVAEVYGGGNEAAGNAGSITIGCTGTLTTQASTPALIGTTLEGVGAVYGGANKADIGTSSNNSNITLTISSGIVGNVYGGNNTSGTIHGTIQVNVNKNAETCGWYVGNVFGGGNLAQYTGAPAVNILNGTVSQNVYGGGKGDANDHTKGQVTGNPVVTIGDNNVNGHTATVSGDVYGGGDAGNVVGTPQVNVINKCNTSIGNVYGGGNAADVDGTDVNIDGGTITGMVFGGGHGDKTSNPQKEANVNGDVAVDVTGGTINKVFGGSNSKGSISGTVAVNINKGTNSCDMHITEVYGGGNEAAGNAGTITIGCTGTASEGIGDVYGGANAADINNGITLNITGGKINNVYGGNNSSGTINGDIVVNVEWTGTCGVNSLGNVYGAGNMAAYTGSPLVNIKNGTVSQNVYGGGKGNTAVVTGAPVVTIGDSNASHVAIVTGDVYGGGDAAAVTGNTSVTYDDANASSSVGKLFGGGNAAGVSGTATVALVNGKIDTGIYGGCNSSGNIGGKITVNVNGGTVGALTDVNTLANVFGGGFGDATSTTGDVEVNIIGGTVNGNVYGGSALGSVNTQSGSNTTTVNVTGGTLKTIETSSGGFPIYNGGNVFGGGLGVSGNANKGKVNGVVTVNIGTGTPDPTNPFTEEVPAGTLSGSATIEGNVYGCNNSGGSPQDNVTVNIFQTAHTEKDLASYLGNDRTYAIHNVFGGGNQADYTPTGTDKETRVNIYTCNNTVERVFGGSNAASAPHVATEIQGGRFSKVFGGGNGEVTPAHITDGLDLTIHGGNVGEFYGGSNQQGSLSGVINVNVVNDGPCESMNITEFFCGGNFVDITGDLVTTFDCSSQAMVVNYLYGGCNQADIKGNVVLNVHGGEYDYVFGGSKGISSKAANIKDNETTTSIKEGNVTLNLFGGTIGTVFGGSNINGNIEGVITVNVLDEESNCPLYITNIYGGSNETDYTPDEVSSGVKPDSPVVNVVHAKYGISGNVYGGSKGIEGAAEPTKVTANPLVNIGYDASMSGYIPSTGPNAYTVPDHPRAIISGSVFGGGDAAKVQGNTAIFLRNRAKVFGNVYGGGNMGEVTGDTKVIVNGANE